ISDAPVRTEYLSERRARKVAIVVPQRGDKLRLVEMAQANARQSFVERRDAAAEGTRQVLELQRRLGLRVPPRRVECVDIATFQGGETVGAVVAFVDGRPWKDGYRRFRIRTVEGTDDFASVAEVLERRFRESPRRAEPPDLLVIDGGLGQLAAARPVLERLSLEALPVIGLAKERVARDPLAREIQRRPEGSFLPGRKDPVLGRSTSTALSRPGRVREGAPRFANPSPRPPRSRARLISVLDAVEGVGPRRRRALLRHFGSLRRVREASVDELVRVPGISPALAGRIREQLATA